MTYLYFGISLHRNEDHAFTVGITKNPERRAYEKHMQIIKVWEFALRKDATKIETKILKSLNAVYDNAFVKFGAWDMPSYPQNRGWDWFLDEEQAKGPLDYIEYIIRKETK